MRNRGDRRGLNPRQLEPQGTPRAKKRSNSKWEPSDDEPPDVRNIPRSDGESVPGPDIETLAADQAVWSQATFGTDQTRGPIGPLKHLEKEAREAQAEPGDVTEYADCLLLVLDAARRAGFPVRVLVAAATEKLRVNQARSWPASKGDEPVKHVR